MLLPIPIHIDETPAIPSLEATLGALYLMDCIQVALLWILDTLQVALIVHALYFYLIKSFGDSAALLRIIWNVPLQLLTTMLIISGVQALYAVRIWKLGRHFHVVLPWFIFLALAVTFGTGVYVMYDTYTLATFTTLEISTIKVSIYTVSSTMAGADFIIAGTMCFLLHKGRSMTNFSSTTRIIKGLMRLVVMSGILTSACSLFIVVAYAAWPNTLTFLAIDLVLPKLYINSLLAMLNSRRGSGANVGQRVPIKMIRFAPHDTASGLVDSGQASTTLPDSSVTGVETDINIPLSEAEGCRSNGSMDDMTFA
ncbi:hypothetical protein F5146DRAFT_1144750 [Armillaria mellea]|nr:hypothetical protein F5146DRAFT_1144750 [Armillaria mellea]